MKWTAELIDYDGNVGALAHVEADSEQEARARLAMCGVTDYIGPVKDVCASMENAEINEAMMTNVGIDAKADRFLRQENVTFDGIPGKWYLHAGGEMPCDGDLEVQWVESFEVRDGSYVEMDDEALAVPWDCTVGWRPAYDESMQ